MLQVAPLRSGRRASAAILLGLSVVGCTTTPEEVAGNDATLEQDARLGRERNCIAGAINATVMGRDAASSASGLEAAFGRQDTSQCPQDFNQAFVAANSALHLLNVAEQDLQSHLAREQAAQQANTAATMSDVWNGKASGNSPWADWLARKGELETLNSQRRQAFEEAKASLLDVAARHGLSQSNGRLTGPDVTDSMLEDEAPASNAM